MTSPALSSRRDDSTARLAPILFFVGVISCAFGIAMVVPMLIDIADQHEDYKVFLTCAVGTLFVGTGIAIATYDRNLQIRLNETLLLLPVTWITASVIGGIPFMLSELQLSFTDAFFETASGLTTTGSTVIVGLDTAPRGLLMWRFLIQWIGGFGVVTIAVLLLPFLRIGGLQLFSLDLSPNSTKFVPRITEVVSNIAIAYTTLTAACAICYWLAGMTTFDAIGHAMTALATAGYSSHDSSIGYFQSASIEWISIVFMLLGGGPFGLYILFARGNPGALLRDSQARLFALIVVVAAVLIAIWRVLGADVPVLDALRQGFFIVASAISTCGFTSYDYSQWGGFPESIILMVMLIGGCTGSTAGGIKVFRIHTMIQLLRAQMYRQILPHGTFRVTYNGSNIPDAVRSGAATYVFIYLLTFAALSLSVGATGMDLRESLGAAAAALGNVGPGLGPVSGPCCTFKEIPETAKWLLSFGMLAGRLEILVFLIPFSRAFWRN